MDLALFVIDVRHAIGQLSLLDDLIITDQLHLRQRDADSWFSLENTVTWNPSRERFIYRHGTGRKHGKYHDRRHEQAQPSFFHKNASPARKYAVHFRNSA